MITAEQVADLQRGDVVQFRYCEWHEGTFVQGPVYGDDRSGLYVGAHCIRNSRGEPLISERATLTVVSRAPRPLYVNHPRTEPVPGDVVRDADDDASKRTWVKNVDGFSNEWLAVPGHVYVPREQLPTRLRLLVDGETGMSVGPDLAEVWAEGFEAAAEWLRANPGPTGIPHDPPLNPYETGQVVP